VLKSFVESEYGIPMAEQSMYIEEKPMMNPLSLLDYPGICTGHKLKSIVNSCIILLQLFSWFIEAKGSDEIYIRVDGPLPADSKK
jgi:hypothetical protein